MISRSIGGQLKRLCSTLILIAALVMPMADAFAFQNASQSSLGENSPIEISSHDIGYVPIKKVGPHYPKDAKKAHVSGDVQVSLLIGLDGKVESATAISGPDLLHSAAEDAARQWIFPPYQTDGVGKKVHLVITLQFRMS